MGVGVGVGANVPLCVHVCMMHGSCALIGRQQPSHTQAMAGLGGVQHSPHTTPCLWHSGGFFRDISGHDTARRMTSRYQRSTEWWLQWLSSPFIPSLQGWGLYNTTPTRSRARKRGRLTPTHTQNASTQAYTRTHTQYGTHRGKGDQERNFCARLCIVSTILGKRAVKLDWIRFWNSSMASASEASMRNLSWTWKGQTKTEVGVLN